MTDSNLYGTLRLIYENLKTKQEIELALVLVNFYLCALLLGETSSLSNLVFYIAYSVLSEEGKREIK